MSPLDIIICMKPVPDPKRWDKLKLDPETMLLVRGNIPAVINQLDRNAIEQAISLVSARGGSVAVVTMAPPDAEDQLIEAMAMGADRAVLLSDPAFAGADTLATSRTLAAAIRRLGRFDLIFCGASSADGSTSQVGPQLAELLGLPEVTHAIELDVTDTALRARARLEDGSVVYEAELPAVVTFDKEINAPRLATMVGIMKASKAGVVRWGAADLGLDEGLVGLKGSPTQMLNVFTAPAGRRGDIMQGTPNELAARLVEKLQAERLLS